MSAAGTPPPGNGNGNGAPRKPNKVSRSLLFEECRAEVERQYPRLVKERFFEQLDTYMVICDVVADTFYMGDGGVTYFMQTPEDFDPCLMIYFTFASRQVVLQAVHAE